MENGAISAEVGSGHGQEGSTIIGHGGGFGKIVADDMIGLGKDGLVLMLYWMDLDGMEKILKTI